MKNKKYLIPEISAPSIISTARKTDDGYDFCFDSTSIPNEYRTENTLQDDCPIFHQAMCILYGDNFRNSELLCEALRDVFVYVDFSGIFNRMPVGRILELQELAKEMFKPKGIRLNFGKEDMTYIAFERSASMSRDNRLSFVRSDIYEALKERMMLGMTIGKCQLSKLYAYNALLFTSGKRYNDEDILSENRIIVIDNPESVVKDVDVITVADDGTDNPVRTYTRVQKNTDVKITEFDGEGLISPRLAEKLEEGHHSFQIRLPYIKGVVHEVDFASLFSELGVPFITDIFGVKHNPADVDIILTKSMFKGFGWMTENGLSWKEYMYRCRKYKHALYVSGKDREYTPDTIELNYQFLNTLAIMNDEFRPSDLPLGWKEAPESENQNWITKTTESAYFSFIGNRETRKNYLLEKDDIYSDIIHKNPLFMGEPMFQSELSDKAESIADKYSMGKLLVSGDNRYLSDDLMKLLAYIIKSSEGKKEAYYRLEKEQLHDNLMYAPMPTYKENDSYTLLRSPHIARNEEVIAIPIKDVGKLRKRYLSHLHYVIMVDSRSLIPERLGGADYDGDMIKTVADPLVNACVKRSSTTLPVLKIPTVEPLVSDANDWEARFATVKDTFSSRVGQISNAALSRGVIAYDENITDEERKTFLEEVETLAILTGLEIDSAKSGIKPDLSAYLEARNIKRSRFLKYKDIFDQGDNAEWYEPTKSQKMAKYFGCINWDSITSNLEKLPYYAYSMAKETEKATDKPAKDSELFTFATEPDWKEKLDSATLQKVKGLISDYETALKRIRFLTHTEKDMKRQNDVYRILMARGQEKEFSVDEIYSAFDKMSSYQVRLARQQLIAGDWQFTPPEERVGRFYEITDCTWDANIVRLFCDFRCGGYRMLGDVISDFDDMHRNRSLKKNYLSQKGDTPQMKAMVSGIKHTADAKNQIISNCKHIMFPIRTRDTAPQLNPENVVKCAVALGKRKFALEVLPDIVLRLTLDSNIPTEETKKKKWRLWQ